MRSDGSPLNRPKSRRRERPAYPALGVICPRRIRDTPERQIGTELSGTPNSRGAKGLCSIPSAAGSWPWLVLLAKVDFPSTTPPS